ncbi:MAG TPA: hypothetical protein VL983_07710 [Terriglobales bacterium]|nr:hypothetical protein [Terriglobales bacterium]
MRAGLTSLLTLMAIFISVRCATAEQPALQAPRTAVAGSKVVLGTSGSGKASLYIVGQGAAIRREIQLGEQVSLSSGDLYNAGRYLVFLVADGITRSAQFDLLPSQKTAAISFLAKPSRLPVNVDDGLSGVVYVFDAFGNLIVAPQQASFELSETNGAKQTRRAITSNGVAWVRMNSAPKAGPAALLASVGGVTEKRIVQQVAGDPCRLKMTARREGRNVILETDPVRDCAGNPVPDGTIVTFTEASGSREATVDVPVKRGVARTTLPNPPNAVISVAAGIVMGNEIRWSDAQ